MSGQPGPFSSTTTVTGLPSTPARKPMRQPQARRACVNPFNIVGRSYYGSGLSALGSGLSALGSRLWFLQERFDLPFELVLRRRADVARADRAVAADHVRRRQAPERALG